MATNAMNLVLHSPAPPPASFRKNSILASQSKFSTSISSPFSPLYVSFRQRISIRASDTSSSEESKTSELGVPAAEETDQKQGQQRRRLQRSSGRVGGESTDWIASSLTRRFGLGAGLAWVGFLAFGVISEQIKTRTEVFLETQGTKDVEGAEEVLLPSGIRYVDLRVGGGSSPYKGDLVVVDIVGKVRKTGDIFLDTTAKGRKSLAFVFLLKPYAGGVCDGVEIAMESMKAGGRRRVIVPPDLGFGNAGADFGEVKIPGGVDLEYLVTLQRVSIAPS
ncbi:hypothetical protein R1sor_027375 [Riccia sorocarpa]|uniref:peptidylprolyl isomerase n=1 Tax=Riccia sorocarpa TaxID=122646 RepID=A0ABD3GFR3_9MARC